MFELEDDLMDLMDCRGSLKYIFFWVNGKIRFFNISIKGCSSTKEFKVDISPEAISNGLNKNFGFIRKVKGFKVERLY